MAENKEPDRLNIRKSDREIYSRLLEKDSPLSGKENKDVFLLAMAIGYNEGMRAKLDKKEGFFRTEYLSDEDKSIIKAIAISVGKDLNALLDKKKVFSIAEEYAAGGIKLLKDRVFSGHGSYIKKLESEMVEEFEKRKIASGRT